MLVRWLSDLGKVREMVEWFLERAEELKSQADVDPRQAISVLMEEMMVRAESSGYAGIVLGIDIYSQAVASEGVSNGENK